MSKEIIYRCDFCKEIFQKKQLTTGVVQRHPILKVELLFMPGNKLAPPPQRVEVEITPNVNSMGEKDICDTCLTNGIINHFRNIHLSPEQVIILG